MALSPAQPQVGGPTSLRRILAGLAPVTATVQAASLVSSIVLAQVLGATIDTDAYFIALSVPVLVYGTILSAVQLGGTPALTETLRDDPDRWPDRVGELAAGVFLVAGLLAAVVTAAAVAAAPLYAGHSAELVDLSRLGAVELLPFAISGSLVGVGAAALSTIGRYRPAVAVGIFEPVVKTVLILTVGDQLGMHALVLGNVAGSALAVTVLGLLLHRHGVRIRAFSIRPTPFAKGVLLVGTPLLIGQSVLQVNPLIDRTMAAGIDEGAATVFELGLRLFTAPLVLLAATAVGPVTALYSRRFLAHGWPALRDSLAGAANAILLWVPPILVVGVIARYEIVSAVYGGGEYSEEQIDETAKVLAGLLLGFPSQLLVIVLVAVFVVQSRTRFPMWIAFANVVLNTVLNLVLRGPLGVLGIALSTTITFAALTVAYVVGASRTFGPIRLGTPARWRTAALSLLLGGVACALMLEAVAPAGRASTLAVLAGLGAIALVCHGVALLISERQIAVTAALKVRGWVRGRY